MHIHLHAHTHTQYTLILIRQCSHTSTNYRWLTKPKLLIITSDNNGNLLLQCTINKALFHTNVLQSLQVFNT